MSVPKKQRPPIWEEVDDRVYDAYINSCNTYDELLPLARSVMHYLKCSAKDAMTMVLYLAEKETKQHFEMGYLFEEFVDKLNKENEK